MRVEFTKKWRLPDQMWKRMKKLIPHWRPSPKGGRPALDERAVADGIYYVMRTGCPWKAAPLNLVPAAACTTTSRCGPSTVCFGDCGSKLCWRTTGGGEFSGLGWP